MIPILTLSYFSTGLVEKLHPPNYIVHLIIISEGGPLPWTLLCCFGIAGPLGLWRFLAAPPWAFGGAVGLVTNGYLEGWILGHQLGRFDVWMRVVGYMTWMTWYIIAIFLFVYIWYIYISLYINVQYICIWICSIYIYIADYIMVCNWNSSDFLGVVYWHATSKVFTHFQPTKTMVIKGFQGPKKTSIENSLMQWTSCCLERCIDLFQQRTGTQLP